jgi:hypothetical protein
MLPGHRRPNGLWSFLSGDRRVLADNIGFCPAPIPLVVAGRTPLVRGGEYLAGTGPRGARLGVTGAASTVARRIFPKDLTLFLGQVPST